MMNNSTDKTTTLAEAIDRFVDDGGHISVGGFTINRNPMAAVHEIMRQRKKDLHLYAHSNGQAVDELIGAGCLSRLEIAYGGSGRFAPTCVRFRRAVEQGHIQVEDYSNYQMTLRFMAGAMGVPFLPTRSGLGSDIEKKWGFSKSMRRGDDRIPNRKLAVIDNPFVGWTDATKMLLVPAINPDVTIIHVQQCDRQGTARIAGLPFADVEQAGAARRVIVTCEQVLAVGDMRQHPDRNQIPFYWVDAVVPVPYGAYPTACYGCYDYDPVYLNAYRAAAGDEARYRAYLSEHVFDCRDHAQLLETVGQDRLDAIKADSRTGYALGLDRKYSFLCK